MRSVIYDLQASGHHPEYLGHLVRYARSGEGPELPVTFVVHPAVRDRMHDVGNGGSDGVVRVTAPDSVLVERLERLPLRRRSVESLDHAMRVCGSEGASRCFLPHLNLFRYALGRAGRRRVEPGISGILFSPGIRSEMDWSRPLESVRIVGTRLRKLGLVAWLLRNRSLQRIYVLNDRATVESLNRFTPGGELFRYLVDPVPPVPEGVDGGECAGGGLRERYGIDGDRRIALLLGSLQRRKGVLQAVEAVALLPADVAARTALVLAGRVEEGLAAEVRRAIAALRTRRPEAQIVLDDRFLEDAEVAVAFRDCDVILAPYQIRHDASSGALGHAARHRKPVIVPAHDLIARLTREYRLGIPTDVRRPEVLARSIEAVLRNPERHIDPERMARYVEERRPERFAATIFEGLAGRSGADPPRGEPVG